MKDFDLTKIFEAMRDNDINELIVKDGSKLYEIRRGGIKHNLIADRREQISSMPSFKSGASGEFNNMPLPDFIVDSKKKDADHKKDSKTEDRKSNLYELKSPLVGSFYAAPKPDAPPFVDIGTKVKKGQTLCIVEAMKNFNEIESEVDGIIEEICVKNAELVEFGKVLFRIKLA